MLAFVVSAAVATPMAVRVATAGGDSPSIPGTPLTASRSTAPPAPAGPGNTAPTAAPDSTVPVRVLSKVAVHQDERVCSGAAPQPM